MDEFLYKPTFSSNFKIEGNKKTGDKLITVFNPWQGAKEVSSEFLIEYDNKEIKDFKGSTITKIPERIVCMSSTHIAMLDALGESDKIVGVSGKQYVSNELIKGNKSILDVGYEGHMDYEALAAVKPDLIILFSVNGVSSLEPKLREMGIPFLYIGDYLEEDPLGKAEWIIPIAEVLGKREKGVEKFKEISTRYEETKDILSKVDLIKPKVMVNAPFADAWFMPSSQSYIARLINDAGGEYIYDKNTGNASLPIDMEEALRLVSKSDFWINIGTIRNLEELKLSFPKFMETECVKEGNVFNNNKIINIGGGNDCYESGVMHPDLILMDLISIFHPELSQGKLTYYHQLK